MSKIVIASTLALAFGVSAANANPAHHPATGADTNAGSMMQSGMMTGPMMGGSMMNGMMNPDMMVIMLDADGDGSLSLAEFQGMHERMFGYLDKNGDGMLDAAEMQDHHAGAMAHGNDSE
ncbi:UNVERIFIED_ORG: EF hand domain-containing protein [Martelella mediterranea]